jgi:hydroxyacylglutathione hydrolase
LAAKRIQISAVLSVPFEENAYVINLQDRSDCLLVDPGFEPERIVEYLESRGLGPAAILVTHGHVDHIAGNEAIKSRWPECKIVTGVDEAAKLTDARLNLSAMFGLNILSPPADVTLRDGESYTAAGIEFRACKIAGHSSGHVVYIIEDCDPMTVLVGDVIFAGSIGRTDFPDGDFDALAAGIRANLYTLPDDTVLLPGHGPSTTVGSEKRSNPFVRAD